MEPEYKTANGDVEVSLVVGGSTLTLTFTKYQGKWMVKSFTKR